jgi:hypothetical protein
MAVVGGDPLDCLRGAVAASGDLCWTTCSANGEPLWLSGCAPVGGIPGLGSPWLLGTTATDRYPGALTRITKLHIAEMLKRYDALINYVDARNLVSVRWLAHLGFTVREPETYGVEGRLFHPFTMGNI